jgi:histidinol-phosphatase (PHP family)
LIDDQPPSGQTWQLVAVCPLCPILCVVQFPVKGGGVRCRRSALCVGPSPMTVSVAWSRVLFKWYNVRAMLTERAPTRLDIDLHIHSNHSCDGKTAIDEMCRHAVAKGVSIVCFTEHVDLDPRDKGCGFFQYDGYSTDVELAREKYQHRLTILKGIEFSEPHLYPREFETITKADFDFVLGSIHWLQEFGAYWADPGRLLPTYPAVRLYEAYYREILKAIRFGGFDSLAHVDFPKRYLLSKHEPSDLIGEAMGELVKKGIALEINSQSIRKQYPEINPSHAICVVYAQNGGRIVTAGSDAHDGEQVGQDFDRLTEAVRVHNFSPVYFRKRRMVQVVKAKDRPISIQVDDPEQDHQTTI